MKKERHVLLVFPHPDDEAFGTSGTSLMHHENGTPVTYACLTLGQMGRNFGAPQIANRETLPVVRKEELKAACEVMKIKDLRLLGFHDKTLEFLDPERVADPIEELLNEINPSLVITFYPGYAVHPDHDACGEAVVRAVRRLPEEKRPTVHAIAITNDRFDVLGQPDVMYPVDQYIDQKIKAIQAHRSQFHEAAAIFDQKIKEGDKDAIQWLSYERFWTYPL
ncbi:bacillithiol biosynthesis deacetylase BshB2 [Bacillus horti]|uniref:Bacillithiol biosynthesis deacetylase BshB2 n=1 Tax=Caldalkalibacillus horti TaxID=77523 RepID=A0ABT9VVN9_9BACI|nr:bacillithiol biosynthesis deacetylase BshB2 [Bacillus horti]MDQ0165027.1 bacillithiol biosynthesis deacetylase BshB2 [Bacillus horti]